mgnify:CR=1 FL=1
MDKGKKKPFLFNINEAQHKWLKAHADEWKMSISDLVRKIIQYFIDKKKTFKGFK